MESRLYDRFFAIEDKHWWFAGRRHIVLDELARYECTGKILDLGCGTGGVLSHLGRFGAAYGIDPSREAIHYCQQRGLVTAISSGMDLPFADETFNAVLVLDVIEHIDDDVALLREVRRVLSPTGIVVVTVPALPWLWSSHDQVNHHRRRYMRAMLERALRAAGLEPVKMSYYNTLLLPLMVIRKLSHRRNGSGDHLEMLPRPANALLRKVLASEVSLIRRWDLPVGASLLCTARRTDSSYRLRPWGCFNKTGSSIGPPAPT